MENASTSCVASSSEEEFEGNSESSSENTLDVAMLQSSDITTIERLKMCFKPKYDARRVKNKGALLVLVMNFLITSVFYYISRLSPDSFDYCSTCFKLIVIPLGIFITVAGWLADIRFGRYKVIYWSSLIMWTSAVLLVLSTIVGHVLEIKYIQILVLIFLGTLGIGYSGFQANVIQFGIDQLTDASTNEIISFINWYTWAYITSGVASIFISSCMSPPYQFIIPVLICVCISIVVCLLFLCDRVFIKEPVTQNPFTLIYRVIMYARKTKCPQNRSAFTYCEDELPSRLDFGKSKYGGPFTTEQVEDVKMFFQVLGVVVIVGEVFGMTDEKTFKLISLVELPVNARLLSQCSLRYIFTETYYVAVAILIPFNELLIHPLFHRCLPKLSCICRLFLGIVLHIGRYAVLEVLEIVARQHYDSHTLNGNTTNNNATLQCLLHEVQIVYGSPHDFMFFAIPEIISAISYILILVATIEFLCAQVPYSMKGLIVGFFYGSLVIFLLLNSGMSQLFMMKSSIWESETITSCRFWYLLTKMGFQFLAGFGILLMLLRFKKRKREDILPNEQIFAERYYSS